MTKPEAPPENAKDDNTRAAMQKIARLVDDELPDEWGYVVLAFPFNEEAGRMNYVSNAKRQDVVRSMREWLRKTEAETLAFSHPEDLRMTDDELVAELKDKARLIIGDRLPCSPMPDAVFHDQVQKLEAGFKYLIAASIINNEVPLSQLKGLTE